MRAGRPAVAYDGRVERCDAAVIGAGPAGSVTAIHLARGGAKVLLVHAEASLLGDLRRHRLTDVAAPGRAFDTLREALAVIRASAGKDSV